MSKKNNLSSQKRLLRAIAKLNDNLSKISEKIDDLLPPEEVYVNTETEIPIIIPEELYIKICDELEEDSLMFMGVS